MRLLSGGSGLRALEVDCGAMWSVCVGRGLGGSGAGCVYVGAEVFSCGLVLYESSSNAPLLSSRSSPAERAIGGLCTVTDPWVRMEEWGSSLSQNDLPGTSTALEKRKMGQTIVANHTHSSIV